MRVRGFVRRVLWSYPAVFGLGLLSCVLSVAAQTIAPINVAAETAVACVQTMEMDAAWAVSFVTNVAEVTFGESMTDRALGISCVSIDGTVETGASPTGMVAWSQARYDAATAGTSIEIGRVSGGIHATGVTNAYGILAWSQDSFATNPATVRIGSLDGVVSANAAPEEGGIAAALCARTATEVTLSSGGCCSVERMDGIWAMARPRMRHPCCRHSLPR